MKRQKNRMRDIAVARELADAEAIVERIQKASPTHQKLKAKLAEASSSTVTVDVGVKF